MVSGLLLVDELVHNMLKKPRTHISYLLAMVSFFGAFFLFNHLDPQPFYDSYIVHTGATLNVALIAYLFFEKMDSKMIVSFMQKYSFVMGFFF